jgi:hypothetical protein
MVSQQVKCMTSCVSGPINALDAAKRIDQLTKPLREWVIGDNDIKVEVGAQNNGTL